MPRRYFGTDGVRGIVGDVLTTDLVERLGRAATLWSGRGRVFVGRDTRAPEFNGVKFFDRDGQKLTDEAEEEIEALLDAPAIGGGEVDRIGVATDSYLEHVVERFGSDLTGLRIGVDCANGAYSGLAPRAFEELGAEVVAVGDEPNGTNINLGCGATDLRTLQQTVAKSGLDLGVAFDGDGDRMLAVDANGNAVDGDQIVAVLALHLGIDLVAVTAMTNLGFHRLMAEHGVRVVTTDVGDRYVRATTSPATGSRRRSCSAARSRAGRSPRRPPSCRSTRR